MKDKIFEKCAKALEYILNNPAIFFSEVDIQAIFYNKLSEINELRDLHETDCTIGRNQYNKNSKTKYKTSLIHREYGLNKKDEKDKGHRRIDLVIFNKNDIKNITHPIDLKYEDGKYLTPDYIFEFGTEKSASSISKLGGHITKDLEKLEVANKLGFLIHIQRNYLLGPQTDANTEKYDNYLDELNKQINNQKSQKIKVLFFKLDLGGPERKLFKEGKVKLYINDKFNGIKNEEIYTEIIDLLKK